MSAESATALGARENIRPGLSIKPGAAHDSSWDTIVRGIQFLMRTLRSFVGLHRFGPRPPRDAAWHTLQSPVGARSTDTPS